MKTIRVDSADHPSVTLRFTDGGSPICPVCGEVWYGSGGDRWHCWAERDDSGWHLIASYSICNRCHTESGNDDACGPGQSLEEAWRRLRVEWLSRKGWSAEAACRIEENLEIPREKLRADFEAYRKAREEEEKEREKGRRRTDGGTWWAM